MSASASCGHYNSENRTKTQDDHATLDLVAQSQAVRVCASRAFGECYSRRGFELEYLNDGTVKGTLNLKEEIPEQCLRLKSSSETSKSKEQRKAVSKEDGETKQEAEVASA